MLHLIFDDGTEDLIPISIAVADYDGDRIVDSAASNFLGNSVGLFLGNGNFSFADPVFIPVGDGPISVISADFDDDGNADLALANRRDNRVTILLGDGAFDGEPIGFVTGISPDSVALGDLNGDGLADIVAANLSSNSVSIVLSGETAGQTQCDLANRAAAPRVFGEGNATLVVEFEVPEGVPKSNLPISIPIKCKAFGFPRQSCPHRLLGSLARTLSGPDGENAALSRLVRRRLEVTSAYNDDRNVPFCIFLPFLREVPDSGNSQILLIFVSATIAHLFFLQERSSSLFGFDKIFETVRLTRHSDSKPDPFSATDFAGCARSRL